MTSNGLEREHMPLGAPLEYAPENELGVVYLFSHWARQHAYKIEAIRPQFPDCVAIKNGKHLRIEFEYKSSGFRSHLKSKKKCDELVCWIHNWPKVPARLNVIELRQEYGMGFNVWVFPIKEPFATQQRNLKRTYWSVPRNARPGDLVLYYKTAPNQYLDDAWKVMTDVREERAGYKHGTGFFAHISRICRFDAPIYLSQLQEHPVLRTAGFVRGKVRGACKLATSDWPQLYRMLLDRNPSCRAELKQFEPGRLWSKLPQGVTSH